MVNDILLIGVKVSTRKLNGNKQMIDLIYSKDSPVLGEVRLLIFKLK
jgi:hypothetical protein